MTPAKDCTACGETKPLDEYYRDRAKLDGLQSRCKECSREHSAKWHAANKDRARRYGAQYRAANIERRAEYDAANREAHAAYRTAYRAENPHRGWVSKYRTRARRYGLPIVVEDFTKVDVIQRYGDGCHYCEAGAFERLDHYVPVSAGGLHTLINVRPACTDCDLAKGCTPGDEWEARTDEMTPEPTQEQETSA